MIGSKSPIIIAIIRTIKNGNAATMLGVPPGRSHQGSGPLRRLTIDMSIDSVGGSYGFSLALSRSLDMAAL
jgi:hypothetical protein